MLVIRYARDTLLIILLVDLIQNIDVIRGTMLKIVSGIETSAIIIYDVTPVRVSSGLFTINLNNKII